MPGLIEPSRELLAVERAEDGNFVGLCPDCLAQQVIAPIPVLMRDPTDAVPIAGGCDVCGANWHATLPLYVEARP